MRRVVLDTNTLASGALAYTGSPASAILDAWRDDRFTLVLSRDIVAELACTLARPYFASRLDDKYVAAFLDLLNTAGELVDVPGDVAGVATHPADDRILEAAVVTGASFLVTGDKQLQRLATYEVRGGLRGLHDPRDGAWVAGVYIAPIPKILE